MCLVFVIFQIAFVKMHLFFNVNKILLLIFTVPVIRSKVLVKVVWAFWVELPAVTCAILWTAFLNLIKLKEHLAFASSIPVFWDSYPNQISLNVGTGIWLCPKFIRCQFYTEFALVSILPILIILILCIRTCQCFDK